MNEPAIFIVGIIIFAITIYGTVMAGGMALTKVVLDQQPPRPPRQPAPAERPPASTDTAEEPHP